MRASVRRASRNQIARRLGAGVLALAAGAACPPSAHAAEEDGRGWFDAVVDFLTRPEGAPVEVPLRKQAGPEAPPSAAAPDAVPPEAPETEAPPPPAPSPAAP